MRVFIILLFTMIFFYGCKIEGGPDYKDDLSDYEVKKIVREVLSSQHSVNGAGLVTSDGINNLAKYKDQRDLYYNRYGCQNSGYASITFSEGDFSLTFSADDSFSVNYHNCSFTPYYYDQTKLNGLIDITLHQDLYDYQNRLLDFSVNYTNIYLYTSFGQIYLDGDMGVLYDFDYFAQLLTVRFISNHLTIENSGFGEKNIFSNVVLDFTMNTESYLYSYKYSGGLYNDYLGYLTFSTPVTLIGYKDKNPYGGKFKIMNEYMSITVIPLDDYYVDIIVQNRYSYIRNRTIHTTWINLGL